MKFFLLGVFLLGTFVTIVSCDTKKSRNGESHSSATEDSISKGLVVTLEGVFAINDRFELFYSNNQIFDGKRVIRNAVYGEPVLQKIIFEVPSNEKPEYLRIDLGSNAEQKIISIKNIKVQYNGKDVFEGDNEKYLQFFPENTTVSYIPNKLNFELKANLEGNFDPILLSNDNLKKSLNKVYNSAQLKE